LVFIHLKTHENSISNAIKTLNFLSIPMTQDDFKRKLAAILSGYVEGYRGRGGF
jgi:hypothetical protein